MTIEPQQCQDNHAGIFSKIAPNSQDLNLEASNDWYAKPEWYYFHSFVIRVILVLSC